MIHVYFDIDFILSLIIRTPTVCQYVFCFTRLSKSRVNFYIIINCIKVVNYKSYFNSVIISLSLV